LVATLFSVMQAQASGPVEPTNLREMSLTNALTLFDQHNHELMEMKRAVDAAQADVLSARQRPNPTLSLNTTSINPARDRTPGGFWDQPYDTVVRLDQTIELGGKRTLRVRAAKLMLAAGRADLQDALRQLRTQTQAAYFDLRLAQEKELINNETVTLAERTLDAAELRLKAGDISSVDVTRIRVEMLRARNDARQAQADRERSQIALAYLLGIENRATEIQAVDPWPAVRPVVMPQSLDAFLAHRPDVQAAEARQAAAQTDRALARSLRTRDVTVGVQYEHLPPDNSNTYGVGFSIPLFLGYSYEGEIRRAENQLLASEEALDKTKALAQTEIARLRADLEAAAARQRRYEEELLPSARKATDAAEFAYRHGALGVIYLIDARRTLHAVQLDAATARADYAKALAGWNNAVTVFARNP